jgi:tetratricopeptide (TPR) repeat protein
MKKAINQIKNLGSDVNSEIPFYDIYVKYGMWLMDQYEFDYAEQNFNEAMKEIEDRRLPNYQRIGIWNSLGQLYSKKGDYTGAKTYFELSFYEAKRTGEYNDWSRLFCYMADNAMNHDHFSEADQYLSQAFEYCSPDKPTQKFFNLFWQACLYFYMNNYKSFLAVFNELEGEVCSYGSETHGPHWGYLYAMAAGVFHITGMTAACQSYKSRSKSLLKGTNNLQMMLLPIKIDAWLLANSACNETVFHNLKELKRLLKTYSLNNVYFKETAQKISKATCSDEPVWRVLFYKIRF